jgi:hypothetical protein
MRFYWLNGQWRVALPLSLLALASASIGDVAASGFNEKVQSELVSAPLKGGLVHAERLPSAPSGIGKPFHNHSLLNDYKSGSQWFEVPTWLAGTWSAISSLELERVDLWTNEVTSDSRDMPLRFSESFGFQKDAHGGVWTLAHYPDWLKLVRRLSSQGSEGSIRQEKWVFTRTISKIEENEQKASFRFVDSRLQLDENDIVVDCDSMESFVTYTKLDSGLIARVSDSMLYSKDGEQIERSRWTSLMKIARPFSPVNEMALRNLRSAFSTFLEVTGRGNLIPLADGNSGKGR